jgi:uncharacterized membrane protein YfcA
MDWRISLVGLVVGWTIGMTGIGAGTLTMPLLVLWIGVPPLSAVGSNVVYSALTKVVGGWQHARLRTVDYQIVARLAVGSVPATILAAWWITSVDAGAASRGGHEEVVNRVIGASLIAAALVLAGQALLRPKSPVAERTPKGWFLGVAGALLGGAVGATSVGSGSFGTAVLSFTSRLQGSRIVGTVTMHAVVLTVAGALTHLAVGTVRPGLVGALLLGPLPGVVLGSRMTVRLPEPVLRGALALLLFGLGVRMQLPRTPEGGSAPTAQRTTARVAPPQSSHPRPVL